MEKGPMLRASSDSVSVCVLSFSSAQGSFLLEADFLPLSRDQIMLLFCKVPDNVDWNGHNFNKAGLN